MSDFAEIRRALIVWPHRELPAGAFESQLLERVRRVLAELQTNPQTNAVGTFDLAGLLGVALRQHFALEAVPKELHVPAGPGWPSMELWAKCGVHAKLSGSGFALQPLTWTPDWLDADSDPTAPALKGLQRRLDDFVAGDPAFVSLTGYDQYVSRGQRMAVRSAFGLAPGETLVVNLPTGSGKSSVFQAPAIDAARRGRTTVVVVPTTALAIDQGQRMADQMGTSGGFAYHSGLSDVERDHMRQRVAAGVQPIVFTSPEAIVRSLFFSLTTCAREGRLEWFVVDECHLAATWGNNFRPEFQQLPGLLKHLRRVSPPEQAPRALLLSGSLTDDALSALRGMYGPEHLDVVSAARLRPEPAYWLSRAASREDKDSRVEELIARVPRPFILYTTKREDAENWYARLSSAGMCRLELVRGGDLSTSSGNSIISRWRNRDIDGVVATSAFGLGIDQGDVRTVIHACIPESLDRFYQEVGRAGRDGRASLSMVVFDDSDWIVAERLADDRIISTDRGLERWQKMWAKHKDVPVEDCFSVPLDVKPSGVTEDSDANRSWNLRTLTLMARARLIGLDFSPPANPVRLNGESDAELQERRDGALQEFFNRTVVRLIEPKHTSEEVWQRLVDAERRRSRHGDEAAFARLRALVNAERPFRDLLAEEYALRSPEQTPIGPVGSDPVTRRDGSTSFGYWEAEPTAPTNLRTTINFGGKLPESGRRFITFDPETGDYADSLVEATRLCIEAGAFELATTQDWMERLNAQALHKRSPCRFVAITDLRLEDNSVPALPVPRVSVIGPNDSSSLFGDLLQVRRPFHLVFLPSTTKDPFHPYRRWADTHDVMAIEAFIGALRT